MLIAIITREAESPATMIGNALDTPVCGKVTDKGGFVSSISTFSVTSSFSVMIGLSLLGSLIGRTVVVSGTPRGIVTSGKSVFGVSGVGVLLGIGVITFGP